MKLPFSYRSQFFKPLLFVSFLGHAVLVGAGSTFFPSPQFSVAEAPTSLEVILSKEPLFESNKERPSLEKSREIQKTTVPSPQRGALQESTPAYFQNPAPLYPLLAKEQGWEGVVVLKVLVQADGRVGRVYVLRSSGYKILDESALKAVNEWRFLAARLGSLSFSSWVKIPIRFLLLEAD